MRKPALIGAIAATLLVGTAGAKADPWEDGMVAYNRGDYLPAIRLFRPLAEAGIRRGKPRARPWRKPAPPPTIGLANID